MLLTHPLNVFESDRAFFDPDNHSPFPMKRISPHPYEDIADIYLKMMYLGPFLNGKSITAYNMLLEAEKRVNPRDTYLVAYSSGNFLAALLGMAPIFKFAGVQPILPWDTPPAKLDQLRLFGAKQAIFTPATKTDVKMLGLDPADANFDSDGHLDGIEVARLLGKRRNWLVMDQYSDPANPAAHEKWTGKQILDQMNRDVDFVAAGLGTTGTTTGLKGCFSRLAPETVVVGVGLRAGEAVPGLRDKKRLSKTGFDYERYLDYYEEVDGGLSFSESLTRFLRPGSMGGPSTGSVSAGVGQLLERCRLDRALFRKLSHGKPKIKGVIVGMDTALLYSEKYSRDLSDKQLMPMI